MTFKEAQREVARLGFSLRKRDGEYRLCPKGRPEKSAYYTNGLDDVLDTAWRIYYAGNHTGPTLPPHD